MSSVPWMKVILCCPSENLCIFDVPSWEFHAFSIGCGVPETCHSPERCYEFQWLEKAKHSLAIMCVCVCVYFSDESEVISVLRRIEFMWSPEGSWQPVCAFAGSVQVRNTEGRMTVPGPHCLSFWDHIREYPPTWWECSSEKVVALSKVKEVFLADLPSKGLRCFCTHHVIAFLSSKLWVSDWE
jgi:hypothetical protein